MFCNTASNIEENCHIRFVGARIHDADVSVDASFESCPVAHAVGILFLVKREPAYGVPSNRHLRPVKALVGRPTFAEAMAK